MPRVTKDYEIGLRGRPDQVEAFATELKSEEGVYYWSGRMKNEDDRSYQTFAYSVSEELDETYVSNLAERWSKRFPGSVCYVYYRKEVTIWSGDYQSYIYLEYSNGVRSLRKEIGSHAEHKAHFGAMFPAEDTDSKCPCETNRSVKRNPLYSPYKDCPPRVKPSTQWAVENIMEAHEFIGRRR